MPFLVVSRTTVNKSWQTCLQSLKRMQKKNQTHVHILTVIEDIKMMQRRLSHILGAVCGQHSSSPQHEITFRER